MSYPFLLCRCIQTASQQPFQSGPHTLLSGSGCKNLGSVFGNYQQVCIKGKKFEDLNGDGAWSYGEPALAVTVSLFNSSNVKVATTTSDAYTGEFVFYGLKPGAYTVVETVPSGYEASTPTSVSAKQQQNANQ